jgi:hypothetical protein
MMKNKSYIIYILLGLCISLTMILILKDGYVKNKYDKTHDDVREISSQQDSLFNLADEVLDVVVHEKEMSDSIVGELDNQVRNKEMTIHQQVIQLKKLLKQATDAKDLAIKQQEKALQMEEMSILQSQQSKLAKQKAELEYKKLLENNSKLLEEIEELKKKIGDFKNELDKFNNIEIELPDSLNIENISKKRKRKN